MLRDSRGYFWPATHAIPEGRLGPASAVSGYLRIEEDGTSRLEIDGVMSFSDDDEPSFPLAGDAQVDAAIAGILIGTDERVLLDRLLRTKRTRRSQGVSQDFYTASRCLVAPKGTSLQRGISFRWLELDLEGYADWLGQHGIDVSVGKRGAVARYRRLPPAQWRTSTRLIELHRYLESRGDGRVREIIWRETNILRVGSGAIKLSATGAASLAGQIEDLLTLLADSECRFAFPVVRSSRHSAPVTIYYSRLPRSDRAAVWHRAWAPYRAIKPIFGDLIETWLSRYNRTGAGFYLYLGNRRGLRMYGEHRFASLAWGLEALHRNTHTTTSNVRLDTKIHRILAEITRKKDRYWAQRLFEGAREPSLSIRISTLVRGLSLGINVKEADAFGDECARLRNNISHFGGPREVAGYDEFAERLARYTEALELIYHALLLQQAGLPPQYIKARFDGGLNSPAAASVLAACGLTVPGWKPDPFAGATTRYGEAPSDDLSR